MIPEKKNKLDVQQTVEKISWFNKRDHFSVDELSNEQVLSMSLEQF
jgi:hypothetical protein